MKTADKPGNAKHQAALAKKKEQVHQLRADIGEVLDRLVALDGQLELLADTRQATGLGFLTPDARAAADDQAVYDRLVRRTQPARPLGLKFLNREASAVGTGPVPAPVTLPAVSASAEIAFTIQHHVRRLAKRLMPIVDAIQDDNYAAFARILRTQEAGGFCYWPQRLLRVETLFANPPKTEGTLVDLAGHLKRLVETYPNRDELAAILRDLRFQEAAAAGVVEGPAAIPYNQPCPWCGRDSLVIHQRATGRDELHVRCEPQDRQHACTCDDEWCPCHRNPWRHRHEWASSLYPKSVDGRNRSSLTRLIEIRKEEAVIEHKATDARQRALALHAEIPICLWASECDDPEHHGSRGAWVEPEDGDELICTLCPTSQSTCAHCRDIEGNPVSWPCETVQALELDPPTDTTETTNQPQETP